MSVKEFTEEVDYEEDEIQDAYTECKDGFLINQNELIRGYIQKFFADKEMHCGGKISQSLMLSPKSIHLVRNMTFEEGLNIAYAVLDEFLRPDLGDGFPKEIRLVINILTECAAKHIPKERAPGILLLYLNFCEGFEFEI